MTGTTLLLIDDSAFSLQCLQQHLEARGYRVVTTTKPENAFTLVRQFRPALIVTDIVLHHRNRFSFFKALFQDDEFKSLPLVFLSGDNEGFQRLSRHCPGPLERVTKPVAAEELLPIIERLLVQARKATVQLPGGIFLSGVLGQFSLADMFQFLAQCAGDIRMNVTGPGGKGFLQFHEGALVDAGLEARHGLEAAYEIIVWDEGRFYCQSLPWSGEPTIQTNNQGVILEALRRRDAQLKDWSLRRHEARQEVQEEVEIPFAPDITADRPDILQNDPNDEPFDFSGEFTENEEDGVFAEDEADDDASRAISGGRLPSTRDSIDMLLDEVFGGKTLQKLRADRAEKRRNPTSKKPPRKKTQ
jgi:CheY-like chemotaxis protein